MNKIQLAINKIEQRIKDKNLSVDQIENLSNNLTLDLEEHAKCQELKSLMFAMGRLSQDDAQQLYKILGDTPMQFESRSLAEKTVAMTIYQEMLEMKVAGKI